MWQTLVGGVVAILGGVVTHWLTSKDRREDRAAEADRVRGERRDAEVERWRERAADAAARSRALLDDFAPQFVAARINRGGPPAELGRYNEKISQWAERMTALLTIAAGHPLKAVRVLVLDFAEKADAAIYESRMMLATIPRVQEARDAKLAVAETEYQAAQDAWTKLVGALHP